MKTDSARFDRDYYRRFYFEPRTSVTSAHEMAVRARLIAAYVDHIGLPVRRMLDAGCGIGLLKKPLSRLLPRAAYVGLEVSDYLCERYGWEQDRIQSYRSAVPFDLVICYDVLQYLDDHSARRAMANLARLCRGILYCTALTAGDWRWNCDQRRTDANVELRPAQWYRTRLRRNFREIGAGFWLRRGAPLTVWELEAAQGRG